MDHDDLESESVHTVFVSVARLYQDTVHAALLPAPLTTFVTEDHSHLLIGVALILVRRLFSNDFVLHKCRPLPPASETR